MTITIHRANQIGGCIIIIEHDGCKIIIDLGSNLPGNASEELSKEDIATITEGANAIFYTHYHGDHTGLHHLVDIKIPQYIGPGAKEVMLCKYQALSKHGDFSEELESTEKMLSYTAGHQILYNGCDKIKVTPYFVSHSAFDAFMFLIECNGKKILHTGDFRKHGYLGKGLFPTLTKYVGEVDILITEGTMLGRKQEDVVSENEIKQNVIDALKRHKYVFALGSSTDLDRLSSFHAACKQTGREFVVDPYQKSVLDVFTRYAGKKSDLFVFDKCFEPVTYKSSKIISYLKDKGFLMPIRSSMIERVKSIIEDYGLEEPWLIYSMWNGYAEEGKEYSNADVIGIRNLFGDRIFDGTYAGFHTSGHADVETLEEVCATVNPRIGVIPIHKDACTHYDMDKVKGYKIFTESEIVSDNLSIVIV